MREHLNDQTKLDAEEIMQMVAGEAGWITKRFLADSSTKDEVKRLFVASQAAAIDLCDDRDDAAQHFAIQLLATIGMFDVFMTRHPEMVSDLFSEQVLLRWQLDDELKKLRAEQI